MIRLSLASMLLTTSCFAAPLVLQAKLSEGGPLVEQGLTWRIFAMPEAGSAPELVHESRGGTAILDMVEGTYVAHVGFGSAQMTKVVTVGDVATDVVILDAGGLRLGAVAGLEEVGSEDLRFDIFRSDVEPRRLVVRDVKPREVVRLKAGKYQVDSRYGTVNARAQADLFVRAGQVTSAVVEHRAAPVTLRLSSEVGGAPIANTSWTILSDQGQQVYASSEVEPRFVLAEGRYEAFVRNGTRTFSHDFDIAPGVRRDIEILLPD